MPHRAVSYIILILTAILIAGCSSTKHIPEGKYLLDNVDIEIHGDNSVKKADLVNYLRQAPNHKSLGFFKLQLATYNLSGRDSSRWYNRWIRRMGQPPVIYDNSLTEASRRQLTQALINRGYMDATVTAESFPAPEGKKIDVKYTVSTGEPHRLASVEYLIPDTAIQNVIFADSALLTLKPGDLFNRDDFEAQRTAITERLRNHGYYAFTKEYITFIADTAENSKDVNLTLTVKPPRRSDRDSVPMHRRYFVRNVYFVTDYNATTSAKAAYTVNDTVRYKDITVLYGKDQYLSPKVLEEKNYIKPGQLYSVSELDRTYESLSRLSILKSVNIETLRVGATPDGREWLDIYVLLSRNKKQSVTFDVEGTNSEGDLGFGLGLTYQHRNIAKGSQLLTTRLRMNYESLSGNFNGLINDRYTEYAAETGITFPRFEFPFASEKMKRRLRVATEFAVSFNYQERPEYTRIIAGAAWKYKWANRENNHRYTFDLIDINYVYLPERTNDFLDQIAPDNPLLRYSYEDHFIMRMGYTYYRTNRRIPASTSIGRVGLQSSIYTLRASIETAGNLLYAFSKATHQKRHDQVYRVFGIQYSQYAKFEIDYGLTRNINTRHAVAFHVGGGIGVPYGNSTVMPFEKRFYAGGANGVRGWSVRTLGPGSYNSRNSVTDFINQCGDIRLDLNFEYRAKLFWVLEGAAFVDGGNIWTIRNYENQPGGEFKLDRFWKQIALAYGVGLRFDFSYFLLRFDLGFKVHNPAQDQERWPIIHPDWHRDATFHFAVGYPF